MNVIEILMLLSIKGVGNSSVLKLLMHPDLNRAISLFESPNLDLIHSNVPKSAISPINDFTKNISENRNLAKARLKEFLQQGISVISLNDCHYPKALKALSKPPPLLFCKGDTSLLGDEYQRVAIIGSRTPTAIGQQNAEMTTRELVKVGKVIVSGLALGIDAIAHNVTLELKGKTIAVVPDVSIIYPATHKQLAKDIILSGGLIVSENPPGVRFSSGLLVQRDRIQAALSKQVYAIESKIGGGTLHAVDTALSLKLPLYIPKFLETGYPSLDEENIQGLVGYVNEDLTIPYLPPKFISE